MFIILIGYFDIQSLNSLFMKGLKAIISICSIIVFYNLFQSHILGERIERYLSFLGQWALVVYVSHFSIISIFPSMNLISGSLSLISCVLIVFPFAIILTYTSIIFGKLIETIPFLNFLLLGKRPKTSFSYLKL